MIQLGSVAVGAVRATCVQQIHCPIDEGRQITSLRPGRERFHAGTLLSSSHSESARPIF